MRLISPAFGAAVRWTIYAEQASEGLGTLRATADSDAPAGLKGADLIAFMAYRRRAREQVAIIDAALYPPDQVDG